jgi:hypothetical protein
VEGKGNQVIEYINDAWYWVYFNKDAQKFYTTENLRINKTSLFGLGTKNHPYLGEADSKQLEGQRDSSESREEPEPIEETFVYQDEAIGERKDDDDLATLIAEKMTTTTTAHARGGGIILSPDNPMQPHPSVLSQIKQISQSMHYQACYAL